MRRGGHPDHEALPHHRLPQRSCFSPACERPPPQPSARFGRIGGALAGLQLAIASVSKQGVVDALWKRQAAAKRSRPTSARLEVLISTGIVRERTRRQQTGGARRVWGEISIAGSNPALSVAQCAKRGNAGAV